MDSEEEIEQPRRPRRNTVRKNYAIESDHDDEEEVETSKPPKLPKMSKSRAPGTPEEDTSMSQYELQRRANIVKNEEILTSLGIVDGAKQLAKSVSKPRKTHSRKKMDEEDDWSEESDIGDEGLSENDLVADNNKQQRRSTSSNSTRAKTVSQTTRREAQPPSRRQTTSTRENSVKASQKAIESTRALFKALDKRNCGYIDFDSLFSAVSDAQAKGKLECTQAEAEAMISDFDKTGAGRLTEENLLEIMRTFC